MASDLVKNCKGLSGLTACKCGCFENLLAAKRSSGVTWGTLTCSCLCRFEKFWLFLIVFVPISCFKLVFLRKAIMSCELLNIFLNYCRGSICASACLLKMVLNLYVSVDPGWSIQVVNSLNLFSNSRFIVALFNKSFY